MRGEGSPSPLYEGEDGFVAWMLDGPDAAYTVALPEPDEAWRGILDTYTKEHSAEYQAQAVIDLARRLREKTGPLEEVRSIVLHTSHHTHHVIGSGSGDPQKYDPTAGRETLDHSVPYVFAVALEDGVWHHERSYAPERAQRPETVELWQKISTVEDPEWTRRYHDPDPARRAFGGRAVITLADGTVIRTGQGRCPTGALVRRFETPIARERLLVRPHCGSGRAGGTRRQFEGRDSSRTFCPPTYQAAMCARELNPSLVRMC